MKKGEPIISREVSDEYQQDKQIEGLELENTSKIIYISLWKWKVLI
jgi:hypothetical protein